MSDRLERASALGARLDAGWDGARVESSLARLHGKRRRRRAVRVGALSVLLAVAAGLVWARGLSVDGERAVAPDVLVARPLRLKDGSLVQPLEHAQLVVAEDAPALVRVDLLTGGARFDVVHRPERRFTVRAGGVSVVDLGTVFTVERAAGRVRVAVEHGRVRVEAAAELTELGAGEARWFNDGAQSVGVRPSPVGDSSARAVGVKGQPPAPKRPAAPAVSPWRALASEGRFDEAWVVLAALPDGAVGDDVEELLLAADAARLSKHAREALPHLERVVRQHPQDARAPLAAFTLGKVLLELGRPLEAADAFATVRSLSPQSALAGDALAREVDASAAAGAAERARRLALEYLRLLPDGPRAPAMRRLADEGPRARGPAPP